MKNRRGLPMVMASMAMAGGVLALTQRILAEEKTEVRVQAQVYQLQLARETLNREVRNRQDEKLGTIQELAVDLGCRSVAYAILDVGGFLGVGGKYVAVPWDALDIQQKEADGKRDTRIVLDMDKQRLKDAPGSFDKDTWPNMAEAQWARDVHRHYGVQPYWNMERLARGEKDLKGEPISPRPVENPAEAERREKAHFDKPGHKIYKAEAELLNRDVKNAAKEDLGNVHDLMIDEQTGEIAFIIVQFEDSRFLEDKEKQFVALPFEMLEFRADEPSGKEKGAFILTATSEKIKRQMFSKDRWPSLSDREWVVTTYRYYELQPYWETRRVIIREERTIEPSTPQEKQKD